MHIVYIVIVAISFVRGHFLHTFACCSPGMGPQSITVPSDFRSAPNILLQICLQTAYFSNIPGTTLPWIAGPFRHTYASCHAVWKSRLPNRLLTDLQFPVSNWHDGILCFIGYTTANVAMVGHKSQRAKELQSFFLLTCLFQDVKGDHFRLRGTLPGYSMHRSSNGDEPLNVQVAGRTLVVQGSKRLSARKRISFCFAFTFVGWDSKDGKRLACPVCRAPKRRHW